MVLGESPPHPPRIWRCASTPDQVGGRLSPRKRGEVTKAGQGGPHLFSFDLLQDALVIGVLLGCFYAAVSLGLSVAFGLLDVPHVAHPAFLVLAAYAVFFLNENFGRSEERRVGKGCRARALWSPVRG